MHIYIIQMGTNWTLPHKSISGQFANQFLRNLEILFYDLSLSGSNTFINNFEEL